MATQYEILKVLSTNEARSRVDVAKAIGESYRSFQTQLDRFSHAGFIQDVGDHNYILTKTGQHKLFDLEVTSYLSPKFSIVITEGDFVRLDEEAYQQFWQLLGQVIRNRYQNIAGTHVNGKEEQ